MRRRFCPAVSSFLPLLFLLSDAPSTVLSAVLPITGCGTRPLVDEIGKGTRIVGGHDAQYGGWPWQVSLEVYHFGEGYRHVCGGSLINHNTVLTAAHCIKERTDSALWRAVIGIHHFSRRQPHTITSRIMALHKHQGFQKTSHENDVALFKLKESIKFNVYIQPICLPHGRLPISKETPCYISGFGYTNEDGREREVLQEAKVNIIPTGDCNKHDWYGGIIKDSMMCAGSESGGIDSCQGDSGGPLVCFFPDVTRYYQIGITTAGIGCGRPRLPGIYLKTSYFRKWINTKAILYDKAMIVKSPHLIVLTAGWVIFYVY